MTSITIMCTIVGKIPDLVLHVGLRPKNTTHLILSRTILDGELQADSTVPAYGASMPSMRVPKTYILNGTRNLTF